MKERINESIRVHKNQLVDFNTVKQRHMMWFKLTSLTYLPLFPCKHILPILCTFWNSVKYVGDQITQMLWLRKFHPPRLTPQVCATMKLVIYLPTYQTHRLYQLESQSNLSPIPSLKHFRDRMRKVITLFDSMKETHIIINVMMNKDGSPTVPTPQDTITPRTPRHLLHPLSSEKKE